MGWQRLVVIDSRIVGRLVLEELPGRFPRARPTTMSAMATRRVSVFSNYAFPAHTCSRDYRLIRDDQRTCERRSPEASVSCTMRRRSSCE
jgi:hypothetical protein